MSPLVSIVILNWNGWKDTIECLESVYQMSYPNYTVILVDNGSVDNSLEQIRAYCAGKLEVISEFVKYNSDNKPITLVESTQKEIEFLKKRLGKIEDVPYSRKLILIKNETNTGFAEGNNIGLRYTKKNINPDYCLLLNNDAIADRSLLTKLINTIDQDKKIGLVQPKILKVQSKKIDSTGFICDIFGNTKSRGELEIDYGQYDNEIDTGFFYASGACLLINNSLLERLDWNAFDAKLFAYYEDVDLSWNARLLGYNVVYVPAALCYHKGGQTSGGFNPFTGFLNSRNRIRVLLKNYSVFNYIWILPIVLLLDLLNRFYLSISRSNVTFFLDFFRTIKWNIINLHSTLKERTIIQRMRVVNDAIIMKSMEKIPLDITRFYFKIKKK